MNTVKLVNFLSDAMLSCSSNIVDFSSLFVAVQNNKVYIIVTNLQQYHIIELKNNKKLNNGFECFWGENYVEIGLTQFSTLGEDWLPILKLSQDTVKNKRLLAYLKDKITECVTDQWHTYDVDDASIKEAYNNFFLEKTLTYFNAPQYYINKDKFCYFKDKIDGVQAYSIIIPNTLLA